MKSFFKFISTKLSIKTCIVLFCFAILISTLCYENVNSVADRLMPTKTVSITVAEDGDVWVFNNQSGQNLFEAYKESVVVGQHSGWEFRDAESYGYAGDMIVSYGSNAGQSIQTEVKLYSNSYIMFWTCPSGGSVDVSVGDDSYHADLYSDVPGGGFVYVYPFQDSFFPVAVRACLYICLFVLVFIVLCLLCLLLLSGWLQLPVFRREVRHWHGLILWMLLYVYAAVQYKIGISNILAFGDQLYYWNISLFPEIAEGSTWAAVMESQLLCFRGYICQLFPSVAQALGKLFKIDPMYLYFVFTTGATSWLCAYVFPELYCMLTKKKATILQVLVSIILILAFWNGVLTAVLVDLFGAVMFLSGVLFALKFINKPHIISALLTGIFWATACDYRTAYQYGIYVCIIAFIIYKIAKALSTGKSFSKIDVKVLGGFFKRYGPGVLISVVGALIILFPQYKINSAGGESGFLPYDTDGAWVIEPNPEDTTLLEASANSSLDTSYTGYPWVVSDEQLMSLKDALYERHTFLQIPQILSVYANDPLNSLVAVAKKMFLAFDPKTSLTYPSENIWNHSEGYIFSFFNYLVLGTALYVLFCKKSEKKGKILFLCFFLGLILPQMIVHVEWRYFLCSYLFLYYIFAYYFIGEYITEKEGFQKLISSNYMIIILISIVLSFITSFSIYY